jgi:hypothetical protein
MGDMIQIEALSGQNEYHVNRANGTANVLEAAPIRAKPTETGGFFGDRVGAGLLLLFSPGR